MHRQIMHTHLLMVSLVPPPNMWATESRNEIKCDFHILYHNVGQSSLVWKFIFWFPYLEPNFVYWSAIWSISFEITNFPQVGVVMVM